MKKVNKYSDMFRDIRNMTLDVMAAGKPRITAVQGISSQGHGNCSILPGTKEDEDAVVITFVDEFPADVKASYDGYLLYDVDTELFAGCEGKWAERSRDILVEKVDIIIPPVGREGDLHFINAKGLEALREGGEVVLVPCKSFDAWASASGDLFVYQEFDWRWAMVLKSWSGKLPVVT